MQFQALFATVAALAMTAGPALALPNAIPELDLVDRAQCRPGHHLVGAGCGPSVKGHTSCSADDRAVVSVPTDLVLSQSLIPLIHEIILFFSRVSN